MADEDTDLVAFWLPISIGIATAVITIGGVLLYYTTKPKNPQPKRMNIVVA